MQDKLYTFYNSYYLLTIYSLPCTVLNEIKPEEGYPLSVQGNQALGKEALTKGNQNQGSVHNLFCMSYMRSLEE